MFQIQIKDKQVQLPCSITCTNEIFDEISQYFDNNDINDLAISVNSCVISKDKNIPLINIGYCPYQQLELKVLKLKKIYFLLQPYQFQYTFDVTSNYTCFDAQLHFSKEYYTVPQNIVIKFQDQILEDNIFLFDFPNNDENTPFEIHIAEGYQIYHTFFENFKFICMNDDSSLNDLKLTFLVYNHLNPGSIIYGKSITEHFKDSDIETINNFELMPLIKEIKVFDFTFQLQEVTKTFDINITIETFKEPIKMCIQSPMKTNVYHITCMLERDFGIDRGLFDAYSNDGTLLNTRSQIEPNMNNNLTIKIHQNNLILVKIKDKVNRLTYFTNISDMKIIEKFDIHNFGIIINKHFVYDESENSLLINYLNNTDDPNEATKVIISKSLKSSHIRTFSELSEDGKIIKKSRFIVPDEMEIDKIVSTYLQRNIDSMKILNSNDNEIEFTDSINRTIQYIFINQSSSSKIKTININGSDLRAIDLVKDIRQSLGIKKNKFDYFEVLLNTEIINFYEKITNIMYDKENIIKIKALQYQKDKSTKEKTINIFNLIDDCQIGIKYEVLTADEIINKCIKNRNEKVKLYLDYNELNPSDIPTIYKQYFNFLILNNVPQRKKFIISNNTQLKISFILNEMHYQDVASMINLIFQLDENQSSFSYCYKSQKFNLPRKFNAGALPNDTEIQINYNYIKMNLILIKFENIKINLKVNVDQPVNLIKSIAQKEFNIWDFSLNSLNLSFSNFQFPQNEIFSSFKIPHTSVISITKSESTIPIFITTSDGLLNKEYNFSEGETVKDVKNHLKNQFNINYEIELKINKDDAALDNNIKLTKKLKLFCFCKKVKIQCQGSIGDEIIEISEIIQISEAVNYIKAKLKNDEISIYYFNEKQKCFEKAELKKYLLDFKQDLFVHKFIPNIEFLNYPFTIFSTERISELNTFEFLKKQYISKMVLSLPEKFVLTQNDKAVNNYKKLDYLNDFHFNIEFNWKKKAKQTPIRSLSQIKPKIKSIENNESPSSYKAALSKRPSIKYSKKDESNDDLLIEYTFKIGNEKQFSLKFDPNSSILDLKKAIALEKGLEDHQSIFPLVNDTFPDDDKKIKEIEKDQSEIIQIYVRPSYINNFMCEDTEKNEEIKILDSEFIEKVMKSNSELGHGGQGSVFKTRSFENPIIQNKDEFWAVKTLNFANIYDEKQVKRFYNEYKILRILNHPNIVKTYGFFKGDDKFSPCMILEYCKCNLSDASKKLTKIELVGIIYEISYAMKYVHAANLIHRDLKPLNILLDENNHVKICDFGIATLIDFDESMKSRTYDIVTENYIAPEMADDEITYDEKIDVYSFGLIIYNLLVGPAPKWMKRIKDCWVPKLEKENENMNELVRKCLSISPIDRMSFSQIVDFIIEKDFKLFDGIEPEIPSLKKHLGF